MNLSKSPFFRFWGLLLGLALLKLLIHLLTNGAYGYHRDEFLYAAQAEHLSWGYMSVPPVTALLAKISVILGGESLRALRLIPALCGTAMVILVGLMVREMGGGKKAVLIACLAHICAPAFLGSNTMFQPVSFNQFCWTLTAYLLIRWVRTQDPRMWIGIGASMGLGLMTKYSILFFLLSLFLGLLLTPHRNILRNRYPWIGVGIGLLIFVPNLIWQISLNWPVLRHMVELSETQLVHVEPLGFLVSQFLMTMATAPIWLAGLWWWGFAEKGKPWRMMAWGAVFTLLMLLVLSGKAYYALGIYPMLFAAGGVGIMEWIDRIQKPSLAYGVMAWTVLIGIPIYPYALPILPIRQAETYFTYMADNWGLSGPLMWEDATQHTLTQDYADMQGWEEMVEKVGKAYQQLSGEEKSRCLIRAWGYYNAGAINRLGNAYGLPDAVCLEASFLFWAPEEIEADIFIYAARGFEVEEMKAYWNEIEQVGRVENFLAREYDTGIYICRNPVGDWKADWKTAIQGLKRERTQ